MEWIAAQCIRASFPCLNLLPVVEVSLVPQCLVLFNNIALSGGPLFLSAHTYSLLLVCLTF